MTIRDPITQMPFSRWSPARKFEYWFEALHPLLWKHVCREYRFHSDRGWRFDYAWPETWVAVEIQGFGYGHQSIKGLSEDNEKANDAVLAGWSLLRFDGRIFGAQERVLSSVDSVANLIAKKELL